jgi:enoyl-CoA hydratase/carnithine racemase
MVKVEDKGNATCRLESRERGAVAWITLDHPGKMNAMGSAMIESLLTIFAELRTCEELRVVVICA